jgi:hypothetical protein
MRNRFAHNEDRCCDCCATSFGFSCDAVITDSERHANTKKMAAAQLITTTALRVIEISLDTWPQRRRSIL